MAAPDITQHTEVDKTEEAPATQAPQTTRDRSRVPAPRRLTKRGRLWLILGIVLVLLVGGFFLWRYFASYESTDDAQVDVHLYPVSARISGYVIKVNVDDNQYVEKGTVLVEIDPRDYQVAVDKAQSRSGQCRSHRAIAQYQCSHHLREHLEPVEFRGIGRRKCQRRDRCRRTATCRRP